MTDKTLLSREVLTRGFNSFDEANSGYLIDENDLLDLEALQSPDLKPTNTINSNPASIAAANAAANSAAGVNLATNTAGANANNMNLLANQPGSFNSGTPLYSNTTSHLDIPQSSFDDLKFNANKRHQMIYSPSQVSQYGMTQLASPDLKSPPHALRFLQDNNFQLHNPSSPGSLDNSTYGSSPNNDIYANSTSKTQQQLLLAERRRKRRESHNAVERRRRDNINDKIQELSILVPDSLLYSNDATGPNMLTKEGKPNKSTILAKSVDYIRQLQTVIDEQNRKEIELQDIVQNLQRQLGLPVTEFPNTSAEIALARIRNDDTNTVPEEQEEYENYDNILNIQ